MARQGQLLSKYTTSRRLRQQQICERRAKCRAGKGKEQGTFFNFASDLNIESIIAKIKSVVNGIWVGDFVRYGLFSEGGGQSG